MRKYILTVFIFILAIVSITSCSDGTHTPTETINANTDAATEIESQPTLEYYTINGTDYLILDTVSTMYVRTVDFRDNGYPHPAMFGGLETLYTNGHYGDMFPDGFYIIIGCVGTLSDTESIYNININTYSETELENFGTTEETYTQFVTATICWQQAYIEYMNHVDYKPEYDLCVRLNSVNTNTNKVNTITDYAIAISYLCNAKSANWVDTGNGQSERVPTIERHWIYLYANEVIYFEV